MIAKRFFLPIFLLFAMNVFGQSDLKNLGLGGFAELDHISYFKNIEGKINGRNQAILQLELDKSVNKSVSLFSAVEFREDFSDSSRSRTYLDEASIKINYGFFDLDIGKQIITWGKADQINPTDNLNPVDYSDVLDTEDETIGILAINSRFYINDWKLQGVFVPLFTTSVLPYKSNSRWFNGLDVPEMPFPYVLHMQEKKPKNDLSSCQYAFALYKTFSNWDISTNYYKGYSHEPAFEVSQHFVSIDTISIDITHNFYKQQIIGFDFSTSLQQIGLRGEAAYYMPEGTKTNVSYLQYVVGIDHNFSNVIGNNNLFVMVQWIQELAEGGFEFPNQDLNHLFQKSVMTRLDFELGASGSILLQGIYNLKTSDYYFQPAIEYSLFDGLNLEMMCDILGGEEGGFFASYKDNNRIHLRLKYNF
ncbi:MAG: hypothetical protein IPM71_14200 [Bacteroidota bacterium]|nr:MAG: hypothetical protein IPM71_14200 [Bacteroidota bacterium]